MTDYETDELEITPPPAQGVRLQYMSIPAPIRATFEEWLQSSVVTATSQPSGFSPGVAARLQTTDNRRFFIKAACSQPNAVAPKIHRKEALITRLIPASAPVPRLLWSLDEGEPGWIMLVFEDIAGQHPALPWQTDELHRVMDALADLADSLTPSPISPDVVGVAADAFRDHICGWRWIAEQPDLQSRLDAWSLRHLDKLVKLEADAPQATQGNTLLHFDIRGDNMLLTPERVWFFDFPHATIGAAFVDILAFAPSVRMQGGPLPEDLIAMNPACRAADPDAINAALASIAGYFTFGALQPPPPGLPSLRAFQAAQGDVTRDWIAARTGWK